MKRFNVHYLPGGDPFAPESYQAVKDGFAWPPFLLNMLSIVLALIWAATKGMWRHIAIVVSAFAAIIVFFAFVFAGAGIDNPQAASQVGSAIGLAFGLGYMVLSGFLGNRWRESELARRGYRKVFLANADDPDTAVALAISEARAREERQAAETAKAVPDTPDEGMADTEETPGKTDG